MVTRRSTRLSTKLFIKIENQVYWNSRCFTMAWCTYNTIKLYTYNQSAITVVSTVCSIVSMYKERIGTYRCHYRSRRLYIRIYSNSLLSGVTFVQVHNYTQHNAEKLTKSECNHYNILYYRYNIIIYNIMFTTSIVIITPRGPRFLYTCAYITIVVVLVTAKSSFVILQTA